MTASRIGVFCPPMVALILGFALLPRIANAQDTSTTTVHSGQPTIKTEVTSGEVLYVSGNVLIVRVDDGQVKQFTVPQAATFNVDGKNLTVQDLKPGMKLTRTITTTSTPRTVQTIRTIKGKVWHVNAPKSVILTLPDNTNKKYNVPEGTMFTVDGQSQSVFHLRKGMEISATVVTDSPEVVETSSRVINGEAPPPPPPPPETPAAVGVILIEAPAPAAPPEPAQVAENTLPKTGSVIPLIGLIGLLSICASLGLRVLRP